MGRLTLVVAGALVLVLVSGAGPAAYHRALALVAMNRTMDVPQPPFDDPQQLVAAYYAALQDAVNSRDFSALPPFFTPSAIVDSSLEAGGASGPDQILRYYRRLPAMVGFTIETSNIVEDDPYLDVDWRYRAAPGSLRGYLDGHDTFTISDGLIAELETQVDPDAAAGAFMPPPAGRPPSAAAVQSDSVRIAAFRYTPQVIQVPVGATVTWTNDDADIHTVTSVDKTIDTGVVEEDVTVSLTFSEPGSYDYYCTAHPGMRGRVIVGDQ